MNYSSVVLVCCALVPPEKKIPMRHTTTHPTDV